MRTPCLHQNTRLPVLETTLNTCHTQKRLSIHSQRSNWLILILVLLLLAAKYLSRGRVTFPTGPISIQSGGTSPTFSQSGFTSPTKYRLRLKYLLPFSSSIRSSSISQQQITRMRPPTPMLDEAEPQQDQTMIPNFLRFQGSVRLIEVWLGQVSEFPRSGRAIPNLTKLQLT